MVRHRRRFSDIAVKPSSATALPDGVMLFRLDILLQTMNPMFEKCLFHDGFQSRVMNPRPL
jgi:hypothetical protein